MPGDHLLEQLTATPVASAPVITVFTETASPRLEYTCRFIFHTVLRVNYHISTDPNQNAEVNYSARVRKTSVHVTPDGLLAETALRTVHPDYHLNRAGIEHRDGTTHFSFDLFSAVFCSISRYEEWLPFKADIHGRFEAPSHSAEELLIPWVDRWIGELRHALATGFPSLVFPALIVRQLATIDVDNLYAFRKKGLLRTVGGGGKDLLRGDFRSVGRRMAVVAGDARDPFDIYEAISEWCANKKIPLVYFILYGGKTRFDRSITPSVSAFSEAFKNVNAYGACLGIHPSYETFRDETRLLSELRLLKRHAGHEVKFSRMHYLRFDIKITPKILIRSGIRADFTMGFASRSGFRAGTAYPFRYFDFETNSETPLVMIPFCAMDGAYTIYNGARPDTALRSLRALRAAMEPTGGWFVTVFHERTFSDLHFPGFGDVFRQLYMDGETAGMRGRAGKV